MGNPKKYRRKMVGILFAFMLLHQTDKLLMGPLKGPISEEFGINNTQFGLIVTSAMIVSSLLYPIWGYLYDRYARAKLLAVAAFIWGATTWMSAIARSYIPFVITRASTGIDDSSYPGLYSLVADYFGPKTRSKVYGILQLTQPIGYLIGMVLALMLAPIIGWRTVFYITGSLGLIIALIIYFGVKEAPRGKAEPEFEGMEEIGQFHFSWDAAKEVFKKKTMWFVLLQSFSVVFPWNVITYFFFDYLAKERGYDEMSVLTTMVPVVLILAGGYFVGGALGDWLFQRTPKGRVIISAVGVSMGAVFLYLAMNTPIESRTLFFIYLAITAVFMPFYSPNVVSTVYDITVPEVRSTAQAVQYFVENGGAALAPLTAGVIADATSMHNAILSTAIIAWGISLVFYIGTLFFIEKDVAVLRRQMAIRAAEEKARQQTV